VDSSDLDSFSGWLQSDLSEIFSLASLGGLISMGWSESVSHPDSFSEMDRFSTPSHIVPEWYFLPFYGALRASSSKLLGIGGLVGSIVSWSSPLVAPTTLTGESTVGSADACLALSCLVTLGLVASGPPGFPAVELSALLAVVYLQWGI